MAVRAGTPFASLTSGFKKVNIKKEKIEAVCSGLGFGIGSCACQPMWFPVPTKAYLGVNRNIQTRDSEWYSNRDKK